MRIIPVIMLFITLLFKNDTYCTPYEGILLFKILLQVVAVSLVALNCNLKSNTKTCAPTWWSSNFVDHLYDYRPNCTPLSLITIINQQGSKKKDYYHTNLANESAVILSFSSLHILCCATYIMVTTLQLKVAKRWFFENLSLELGALHGCTCMAKH